MRKIIIVSLVAISLSLFSTPAMSYATSPKLSERDLAEYLKHNSPTRIIEPRYLGNDEPGRGSLQGETAVLLTESSSKSPTLYGAIPSWCDDVSVIVFPDTANIETGDGLYLYSGLLTDDAIYEDLKVWQLDLQEAGLGLINGKYNVYVAACLEDGVGGEPLYSDIFYDKVSIYPEACNTMCTPVHRFYNKKTGAHFYTSVEHEKRLVMEDKSTFNYEGIANFAPRTTQASGFTPIHRFYHKQNGTHFYTSNQSEASKVNNTMSETYKYEGVSYYSHKTKASSRDAVHRFYKFKQGVHFYTSNQSEASKVNNTMSETYKYEGVSYYNMANRS